MRVASPSSAYTMHAALPIRSMGRRRLVRSRLLTALAALAVAASLSAAIGLPSLALSQFVAGAPGSIQAFPNLSERAASSQIAESLDSWDGADRAERLASLRLVAEREASRLCLPYVAEVDATVLPDTTRGLFKDGEIYVSEALLDSSGDGWLLGRTVAHESYHFFQQTAIADYSTVEGSVQADGVDEALVAAWRREFADYKEDGDEYYDQLVESTAREYSDESMLSLWLEAGRTGAPDLPPQPLNPSGRWR